jgi:hypothetical protein
MQECTYIVERDLPTSLVKLLMRINIPRRPWRNGVDCLSECNSSVAMRAASALDDKEGRCPQARKLNWSSVRSK